LKIVSTSILLFVTLLFIPLFTWWFGTALGEKELIVLRKLIYIALGSVVYTFIVGELSRNNSQVDKLWSILPIIYIWVVAYYSDFSSRLVVMGLLVTIWGVRLTANFALKGAYSIKFWDGEEDYRWKILREKPEFKPSWKWSLFNLLFICGYQNVLILLFTLPALVAFQFQEVPMGLLDYIAAGAMFFFILFESVADKQHWDFQNGKWKLINAGKPLPPLYNKGFLDRGLWAHSRHPNYFAEQAIWISFYVFSVAASGQWFNWSIIGCLLLIILFQGSSKFSEEISASKYPEYKNYQERVPQFIPLLKKN